jgi:glycine cleavage system H protein
VTEYEIPDDLRYSREDEWVRTDGGRVLVGVSDYAQQQLGDIVYLELPEVGNNVNQGDTFGVIESVKAVSDLFAPLGGEVVDVNTELVDNPEAVNEDCYGDGWMIALAPDDPSEIEGLLDAAAYRKYVDERSE